MSTPDQDPSRPSTRQPDDAEETRDTARRDREYGHSSGDRNVRHDEDDPPSHRGGIQREATPDDRDELAGKR